MLRSALVFALLVPAVQDRQITVHVQVVACRTGQEKKPLPAGKLDKVARLLDEQTLHNQFEVVASGSVRTEDGVTAKVSLGTAMNLSVTFKAVLGGTLQLADLVFTEEKDQEVTTITATSTVKEMRRVVRELLKTKCSLTDEEPILVGLAGAGDASYALVVKAGVK